MEALMKSAPLRASRAISQCSSSGRTAVARRQQLLSSPRNAIIYSSHHQSSSIHTSGAKSATPFPHAEIHSEPPPPPEPAPTPSEDRLRRRRAQAELLQQARELKTNPSKPSTALRKRFWRHATVQQVDSGLQVHLDTRPVRTANKQVLVIPKNKRQLALGIALEWDLLVSAQQALKQHYIPLTALISRAQDIEEADQKGDSSIRANIITMLMRYFTTDTLLCWAPETDIHSPTAGLHRADEAGRSLRDLQKEVATPIIAHLTSRVWPGVELNPTLDPNSILPAPQPAMTQEIVRGWITGLKAYELAGLERAVLATKSVLVGVRLLVEWSQEFGELRAEGADKFGVEEASKACSLEVDWQTAMWGEVDDTHDVDKEDVRRQLGGVVLLVSGETA